MMKETRFQNQTRVICPFKMELNKIIQLNVLGTDWPLNDESVNCCITSPPYWALRDYGVDGQIGMEKTPEEYIQKLVEVFRQVRRVLRPDGTLWLNIADTYFGGKGSNGASQAYDGSRNILNRKALVATAPGKSRPNDMPIPGLKPKDLVGIPWMLAFALRADGWYLRQDIIWSKLNPMPESVTDRCTKSHEYLFLLSKEPQYYYDAESIKTIAFNPKDDERRFNQQTWDNKNAPDSLKNGLRPRKSGNKKRINGVERVCPVDSGSNVCSSVPWEGVKANKRSVWTVTPMPFKEAHFATFPPDLIVDCIKAGCPPGGIVLDPFMGAGTTAMVARKLDRNFVGFELNPDYIKIANNRLQKEIGLFL